jgi:hypothetical protein
MFFFRLLAAALISVFGCSAAASQTRTFGPFQTDPTAGVITLNGMVNRGAALDFRRAMTAMPNAKLIVLNSPGGNADEGLLIADDVHRSGFSTLVRPQDECHSACSFIFFGGRERRAEGKLGVHQLSVILGSVGGAQLVISDIIDLLDRFDTSAEVLTIMFRTPPEDIHIFSAEEIARLGINRAAPAGDLEKSAAAVEDAPTSAPVQEAPAEIAKPTDPSAVQASAPRVNLSAIDAYTKRPAKMAVYVGFDLYGGDIKSTTVSEVSQCTSACLGEGENMQGVHLQLQP